MLTTEAMVISVKILTKSVAVARLDNQRRTKADQCTWKCSLPCWIHWCGPNVSARNDGFEKNAAHHTRWLSPQPLVVITYGWYCTLRIKFSEQKNMMNETPDHVVSRCHDEIKIDPTKENWIPAHIPSYVEQVTVTQRNEIGRHGNHGEKPHGQGKSVERERSICETTLHG
jgi:hypothetical protein